jgi:nucleotidyltransferase substrate binding protein (TIGR01987 family)
MADFDLNPIRKALASLKEILAQPKNKFIITKTIQNFEFTFELAWKAMRRLLKLRGADLAIPMQVFRGATKEGLIQDIDVWTEFLKKRNLTVHTYNENTAEEVYQAAARFPQYVDELILKLSSEKP